MLLNVFGRKIFVYKNIPYSEIGPGTEYAKELDDYLNFIVGKSELPLGEVQSSVSERQGLGKLSGTKTLIEILTPYKEIMEQEYGFRYSSDILLRIWANRMFKDSIGRTHMHTPASNMVGIFYYEVPKGSGNLVFVNNKEQFKTDEEIDSSLKFELEIEQGMLVCHPPMLNHTVSRHTSEYPRTSIIFEIQYE